MARVVAAVLLISCVGLSLTAATECDIPALLQKLKNGEIDLREYTKQYTKCLKLTGGEPTSIGFQPSCDRDDEVTQAVAKFENQGTFTAADGKDYPFSVKGVVTFTNKDSKHTRIHAVVSGTHAFLFDSEFFSLHVHQKGETNPSCSATGGHYNPCKKNHSNDPSVEDRHVGDVARVNIPKHFSSDKDVLVIDQLDTQVKLSGPLSVLGRSITVHGGSASTRVGCATIAVTEWEGAEHPDTLALLSSA